MAFCGNCMTELQDNVKFCPSCGKAAQGESVERAGPRDAAQDAAENKTMAILAYIFFFVPLLTGAHRTSPFVKYHTNQGTVLFLAAVIYGIAYGILSVILAFIPVIGWLLIMILGIASLGIVVLCVIGIMNAANGRMRPLPLIGGMTLVK